MVIGTEHLESPYTHDTYIVFFFDDIIYTNDTHDPNTLIDCSLLIFCNDLDKLEEDYWFGCYAKAVDLRGLAMEEYEREDLEYAGIKGLAMVVMGRDSEKPGGDSEPVG
ncbi:hypothetical protein BUALT_Bualt13G0085600 [Buddleja alternifolia]|uniref:Uncharacterized protein n=1 Tax=Buddleja alternifolia TaxID=168488 RepID=A0AAV6WMJ6_9LAMI|nr:hypothetical protein BUALT_Bualt13G0085600 [Buddleja alternifolia]